MLKLKKFLKPFIMSIMAAIVLLFSQALCDLKLPNLMSDIVNVGIQQNGIEHGSPEKLSENAYHLMSLFMTDEELSLLEESYIKNEADSTFELNEEVNRDALDESFGSAAWTFINTVQSMVEKSETMNSSALALSSEKINLKDIYQMIPVFEMLPKEQIAQARDMALMQNEMTRKQTATIFAKLFYEEVGMSASSIQVKYILKQGGLMLLVTLLGAVATIAVSFLASRISAGLGRDLRKAIFAKVESFSNAEFDKFSTSSLITRTTNDITQVQMVVVMGIRMIFYAPIIGIGGVLMILDKNTSMVWILGLAIILLMALIGVIFMIAMPKFNIIQKLIDRLNLVSRENLTGLMVVRAFGAQDFEEKRFDEANTDLTKTNLFVQRVMNFMMPCMNLIMNLTTLLIVWVGANQIAESQMQVGDMMAFMQYGMQIIMSFLMIAMIFIFIPRASVSAKRIAEVLETVPAILDPETEKPFDENQKGVVEFRNVSFRYAGAEEDVLHDVSFTARPKETTAFIGSTGSGKSTLINLIPRFYDVSEGQILVNGVDVREVSQKRLHEQIGYVPQKGVLLSGTIDSNLRYGNMDASQEVIENAAAVAQASEFINSKEDGFETSIAEGGTNVSGGQKQRLSIARALATQAPIYIFDDSFSALDFKTDATLRAALKENISDATILIVAQRVSTIMNAQQILVLDEGKVVGKGTHEELLKSCPTYYEIAASQLSKEEL